MERKVPPANAGEVAANRTELGKLSIGAERMKLDADDVAQIAVLLVTLGLLAFIVSCLV